MKKTLKLVGIFIAIITLGFGGGIAGYYLIQKNKTFYIYDLRLVEPVEGASSYIYMDSSYDYTSIKNTEVYMTSSSENMFPIAIYANTSNGNKDVKIESSDESVAEVVYDHGKCYVQYKKAGKATITVSMDKVKDSFNLFVHNRIAENFNVYDDVYYGKYAEINSNKIIAYADDITYEYDFVVDSMFETEDNDKVNCDLLRVDQNSVDSDIFDKIEINPTTQKLVIQCKSSFSEKLILQQRQYDDTTVAIQSYYYSEEGEMKFGETYYVKIHIIADTPEFLQVVMSATADFQDSIVLMDTNDYAKSSEQNILDNIDDFLQYQKAEKYLLNNKENSTYKCFLTDKVSEFYIKFRKVYTNGDIVYLNDLTKEDNPFNINCEEGYLTLSQNKEYYILKINKDYFYDVGEIVRSFNITISLGDFINFYSTFVFEFKEFNEENVLDFYEYDNDKKIFTYTYWDARTRYYNEICDASGKIVNFGGLDIDFDALV